MSLVRPLVRDLARSLAHDLSGGVSVADVLSQFIVFDSDGNCHTVTNEVLDAQAGPHIVSTAVLDSDGNSFSTMVAYNVLDSDANRYDVPVAVLDSDGNSFDIVRQVLDSDGNAFTMACGGTPPVGYLVQDTFTDSNGTALAAHTPDVDTVGGGWSELQGGYEILSNRADADGLGSTEDRALIDSGAADCTVSAGCNAATSTGGYLAIGLLVRSTDNSNFWVFGFDVNDLAYLGEFTASVWNVRSSSSGVATWTNDRRYNFVGTLSGTSLSYTVTDSTDSGNTTTVNHTSSVRQSATNHGFFNAHDNAITGNTGWIDDFTVVS